MPIYACLYRPPAPEGGGQAPREPISDRSGVGSMPAGHDLCAVAQEFSPRYERHDDNLIAIDVSGLDRLFGSPTNVGAALRREAVGRGLRVHVAVAATWTTAVVLARAQPGVTVIESGGDAAALAAVPIGILRQIQPLASPSPPTRRGRQAAAISPQAAISATISAIEHWGIRTLGDLAALPPDQLSARLGRVGLACHAIARGEDVRPLVPELPDERFESSLELEWPIEGLEPLSFVLTRLLEPLSIRLERRDRGAAVLHVQLDLVTHDRHARRLELPSPMRDVRTLRTLALLDLESHPPSAAIDRVAIVIDPTPGRVLQHTLFTRPHPTPEQLSTLVARLGALMGSDRVGAAAPVDSDRPGAFEMKAFATEHPQLAPRADGPGARTETISTALRRCRAPVPARVAVSDDGRPVRVTTDRRGFVGGTVVEAAGPWRTSGHWWSAADIADTAGSGRVGDAGRGRHVEQARPPVIDRSGDRSGDRSEARSGDRSWPRSWQRSWDRDEWEVALSDGAVYRIFLDRRTDGWFIDALVD